MCVSGYMGGRGGTPEMWHCCVVAVVHGRTHARGGSGIDTAWVGGDACRGVRVGGRANNENASPLLRLRVHGTQHNDAVFFLEFSVHR